MATKRKIITYIFSAAIIILAVYFFYRFRTGIGRIIWPFFAAVIIAYLLTPLVRWLERRKISRGLSIIIIYLVFLAVFVTFLIFIVPELVNNTKELMATLPQITNEYQDMLNGFVSSIQSSSWPADIKNAIFREFQNSAGMVEGYILNALKKSLVTAVGTITAIFDLILSLIIAYYFIKDAEFFKESALSLIPRKWRNGLINTGRGMNVILANFIQGQLLTALIVGIMETAGLLIVKVKYPMVLGLIGGIANIIPYFGPIIGAVPAVAVALLESPIKALWAAVVFTIVQQIDNAFISPKIIEGKLGLHPVTTMFAVLVGGEFFGILGMLIAVPILAMLKVVVKGVIEAIV